jgi:hypothetical protein
MILKGYVQASAMLLIPLMIGCAGKQAQSNPEQSGHTASAQTARPASRFIYVTDQNLPDECYTSLGPVTFTEPYADAVVDTDQSEAAKNLRAAALKAYPRDVDAVINFKSEQNDVGTLVTVSGEAVRIEDRPTMHCAVRNTEGTMDTAAELSAGGIMGATAGGLVGGAALATSAAVVGISAMGAKKVLEHEGLSEQEQEEFSEKLGEQRRQIKRLLSERAQLQKCQEQEIKLKNCPISNSQLAQSSSENASSDNFDRDLTDATPFEIEKHLQEQHDYIKKLEQEIDQIKWKMGGT